MTKIKLSERIQLVNGGRSHYLEFLRNLTPQVVLFSIVLLLGYQLNFTRFDLGNWVPTLMFFILLGAFALAFYANSTLFYEKCFPEWKEWLKKTERSIATRGIRGPRRLIAKLKAIWCERFVEFVEVVTAIYFLQIALAIVIAMGMHSASTILRASHLG